MNELEKRWAHLIVSRSMTLLQAVKRMDEVRCKLLLVMEEGRYIGLVSIGDVQRAIIRNLALNEPVGAVLRSDVVVCEEGDSESKVRAEMLRCRAAFMPLLSADGTLKDVVFWEDVFSGQASSSKKCALGLPVVIMAGGAGARLRPLTNILPKPLLPYGEKTIIETIMDRFIQVGCNKFYLSLNYKAALIRHYFAELQDTPYEITIFEEENPLGTAGSLSLIADSLTTPFIVSNCDILIEQDFEDVWEYHRTNRNELTIVAALKHVVLAYGSLITGEDGLLRELSEKPEWVFKINSGVYILEPHLLSMIPSKTFHNMTDLIDGVVARGGRVGVFPVSERSWTDIGNWDDYSRLLGRSHPNR
ncbi:MAG: sugar phosphate nucleotidyltransferase [Pirellulaceae bacterium]